jgi:ABC-type lipoprotein export system ATPase subunit
MVTHEEGYAHLSHRTITMVDGSIVKDVMNPVHH